MPPLTDTLDNSDDTTLIARIRAGDQSAFESMFRAYVAAMMRFAISFVADRDAAEDIVQEVFGRIWARHAEWSPPSDLLAYLLAAVRNRSLNLVTTGHRRAELTQGYASGDDAPILGRIGPTEQDAELESQRGMLWGVIHRLPERRRTVILLRWRYELDWDEIAAQMGMSVAAVRMQHSRALQDLRKLLPDGLE